MKRPIKFRLISVLSLFLLASSLGHAQTNETYAIKGGTVVRTAWSSFATA